jgi:hypothetical protein
LKKVIIYSLASSDCPDSIRYIGKTKCKLKKRFSGHMSEANTRNKYNIKNQWINNTISKGNQILVNIVDEVPIEIWEEKEIEYIQKFKDAGHDLLNIKKGGQDRTGNFKLTEKQILNAKRTIKIASETAHKIRSTSVRQLDRDGNLIKEFDSIRKASREVGISSPSIIRSTKFKDSLAGGFKWEVIKHAIGKGNGNNRSFNQYTIEGKLINNWNSLSEASDFYNVPIQRIWRALNGVTKTFNNSILEYANQ